MARRVALFLTAFLLVDGALILFPAVDLWASGLFYRQGAGFYLSGWPPFHLVHADMPDLVEAIVAAAGAVLLLTLARGRAFLGFNTRAALFLLLALALGPGLVVNVAFKDHWGRARPSQVTAFGGDKHFTPAFVPSDQCDHNCSFPAGDPSVGFFFVAPAFLLRERRRRRLAIGGALALGAFFGLTRLAQGGHFLSDVVASGFLVFATSWLAYQLVVARDGLGALGRWLRHPSLALRRFALFAVATAVAVGLSVAFLDVPLARYFHDGGPALHHAFRIITALGVSTGYLIVAAVLALGFYFAAQRIADAARARLFAENAARAFFVFLAVALSGLVGIILKPIFGRARPKLLFADHVYGFTWHGAHADYWSFPSGHTLTIVGLAAALSLIHPRGRPFYIAAAVLVAASRVVLTQHYLSDVLAAAFIAVTVTWALWSAFARAGFHLALESAPLTRHAKG
jgi:lipid A 4'-phosphatase